jgi:hypothetical protein
MFRVCAPRTGTNNGTKFTLRIAQGEQPRRPKLVGNVVIDTRATRNWEGRVISYMSSATFKLADWRAEKKALDVATDRHNRMAEEGRLSWVPAGLNRDLAKDLFDVSLDVNDYSIVDIRLSACRGYLALPGSTVAEKINVAISILSHVQGLGVEAGSTI